MGKRLLAIALLLGFYSAVLADQKPNHYDDWKVTTDKVTKKTTLVNKSWPRTQGVPGMGDAFSASSLQVSYSFKAVFMGTPGTKTFNAQYILLFDNNILVKNDSGAVLANPTRFFKYSADTQFTLLIDDNSSTIPTKYVTGQFGDDFIGRYPYEEVQVPLTYEILQNMDKAKVVAGNLSSTDDTAGKSFTFDNTFKEILNAFLYRVNEMTQVPASAVTPTK